ncbi:MAG: aminotransferase class V-fold PLP-dependent enzyme [Colwellia sp.]|nr:aminotransferase class V-fold PLP-dependent enzyme [Colwellia sp.]
MFNAEQLASIRNDFPGLKSEIDGRPILYLDSAATSLKPQAMIDATVEYYGGVSSNVHRGKSYAIELVSNKFERARYRTAELISCSGNEIVFVRNTTDAINMVASGLDLTKDDTVLICADSHHSHQLPWMARATTEIVNLLPDGGLDLDDYRKKIKNNPKVVAITHCSNVTGVYNPLSEMAKLAKENGAIVVVDAAQSIPHKKVNVLELDIDFLTFSPHKMLGPTGLGVLYGKKDMLEKLTPNSFGGGMVDWVELDNYRLRKLPHRLEAGTPHIAGVLGLGASIDYLNSIGLDNVEAHDKHLGSKMLKLAQERDYLKVIHPDPTAERSAVLSFWVPTAPKLDDTARVLSDTYGIMCRNGHLCAQPYIDQIAGAHVMRISAYLYNNESEIERFFSALDEINSFMF